jgi:hypothetical protein
MDPACQHLLLRRMQDRQLQLHWRNQLPVHTM